MRAEMESWRSSLLCAGVRRTAGFWRRLAVSLFESGHELDLDGSHGRTFGSEGAGERGARDGRSDLEGAGDLGKSHLLDITIGEVVEEAIDGGEEFVGGFPFMLAIMGGATGPIGGFLGTAGGLSGGGLLQETCVKGMDAVAPAEAARPPFDGVEFFAEVIGGALERAGMAESEEGLEGAEGAGRFAW